MIFLEQLWFTWRSKNKSSDGSPRADKLVSALAGEFLGLHVPRECAERTDCQTGSPRDKRVVKIEGKFPGYVKLYEMETMTGLAIKDTMRVFDSNFPQTTSGYLRISGQRKIGTFDWENLSISINTLTKQGGLNVTYNTPKAKSWSLNFSCSSLSY